MKNTIYIILSLISPILLSAQSFENIKFSTKLGSVYEEKINFFDTYINYNDYIISFEIIKNDIKIKKFSNKDLSLISTKIIEDIADELWVEHVGIYNDKFCVFYSVWDKENEYEQLIVRELNTNSLEFINDGKVLFKVKGKVVGILGTIGFYKFQKIEKFHFKLSSDKQNLLIHYQKNPLKKDDDLNHNITGLYAFDLSMNELWNQEITLPYVESKMDTLGYFMTEKNSAYMFIAVYNKKSNRIKLFKDNRTCKFQLIKIEKDKPKVEIIDIPIKEEPEILTYLDVKLTQQNEFVVGGYYSKNHNYSSDGLYNFKFKPDGEIIYQKHYEFPLSFLNKYAKKSEKNKNNRKGQNKAELSFLKLRKIYVDKDGALRIVGEQFYIDSRLKSDAKEEIRYVYKNIFISKLNSEGELVWNTQLPKYQIQKYFFDDMSYNYFDGNGLEYFFFLDATANKKIPIENLPKMYLSGSPGTFTVYIVNSETGDFKKKFIFDTRNAKGKHIYYFQTSKMFQISDNEFGTEMYIKKKKNYRPLKITFN